MRMMVAARKRRLWSYYGSLERRRMGGRYYSYVHGGNACRDVLKGGITVGHTIELAA